MLKLKLGGVLFCFFFQRWGVGRETTGRETTTLWQKFQIPWLFLEWKNFSRFPMFSSFSGSTKNPANCMTWHLAIIGIVNFLWGLVAHRPWHLSILERYMYHHVEIPEYQLVFVLSNNGMKYTMFLKSNPLPLSLAFTVKSTGNVLI